LEKDKKVSYFKESDEEAQQVVWLGDEELPGILVSSDKRYLRKVY